MLKLTAKNFICSLVLVGAFCFKLESSTMPLLLAPFFFFQKTKNILFYISFLKNPKKQKSQPQFTDNSQALSTKMPRMWMNSSSGNGRSIMMPPYSALHLTSVQPQTMNEVHLARSIARHGFKVHPFSQIIDGKSESGAVVLCSRGKSLESSLNDSNVKVVHFNKEKYQQ
jgi:hypothetical protein